MKLAVIDIDGVIANTEARFAKAEEERQAFLLEMKVDPDEQDEVDLPPAKEIVKEAVNLFWRTAFDPELVALDMLIEGAKEHLESLRFGDGYELLFLTSRPEVMRAATVQWLFQNNILYYLGTGDTALVMKAPAFQYVKTVVWKAGMIQTLAALYGADDLVIIDDEPANIQELQKYEWSNLRCYGSLQEAVEALQ